MYTQFFNLDRLPFENVPDPDFFFDGGQKSHALYDILSSIDAGRGLIVVTGAIGSGKTMLSQMVMSNYEAKSELIWLAEPPESGMGLLEFLLMELGIEAQSESRVVLIEKIRSGLMAMEQSCLLIIDEAQHLNEELAVTIKLLNNLERKSRKLIQILLLGQEELLPFINQPQMISFKQRIATLKVIGRLEPWEVKLYIEFRLDKAGGRQSILDDDAVEAIVLGSSGIPRLINSLCNKALEVAATKGKPTADIEDVYDGAQGLVDRKAIFQMMLSLRSTNPQESQNPPTTPDDEAFGATVAGLEKWDPVEPKKQSLAGPLTYLLISSILLAVSLYVFIQNTPTPLARLLSGSA